MAQKKSELGIGLEVASAANEAEIPQVVAPVGAEKGPDAANAPEVERDEKSPEAFAEKHKEAEKEVQRARMEAWAMHQFIQSHFGSLVLKEFGPQKVAQALEHLANNETADQPIDLSDVTPLQWISQLSSDRFQAAEFFNKAEAYYKQKDAENLERDLRGENGDAWDPDQNPSHVIFYLNNVLNTDRERMRLQAALDYVGAGGIALSARDGLESVQKHQLNEMRVFNDQKSGVSDFSQLTKHLEGIKTYASGEVTNHFRQNKEVKIAEAAKIRHEFEMQLAEQVKHVETEVSEKFGEKREELLKKLETQEKFLENQESPLAQEQFKTIVELTAKEYEATLKAADRLRAKLMAPWEKAQKEIEKWRTVGEENSI